ncbi:MAG: hypothetical protein VX269_10230 [Verrucomicrobiota bacterium]|nr:hypothetical protein [Verrucomicrobiota bacterium]
MDFLLNQNNKPLKVSLSETKYLRFKRIADERGVPIDEVVSKLIQKKLADKSDKTKRISYQITEN